MSLKHKFRYKETLVERTVTPQKAIRFKCMECVGWSPKDVAECTIPDCELYNYRLGNRPTQTHVTIDCWYKKEGKEETRIRQTPLNVIRHHCLNCFGGSFDGIRNCPDTACPVYPYRMKTIPKNYQQVIRPGVLQFYAKDKDLNDVERVPFKTSKTYKGVKEV